jgi:hypothetical protein
MHAYKEISKRTNASAALPSSTYTDFTWSKYENILLSLLLSSIVLVRDFFRSF